MTPRNLALAAAIVAVAVLAAARFQGWGPFADAKTVAIPLSPTTTLPAGVTTTTSYTLNQRTFAVGDCLMWDDGNVDEPDHRGVTILSCDEPHIFEVTDSVTLTGKSDEKPDAASWGAIDAQLCAASVDRALGRTLDPHGRFDIGDIHPTVEGWSEGDRRLTCGIVAQSYAPLEPGHEYHRFTGKAAGQPQDLIYGTGTCLSDGPGDSSVVADCAAPHSSEVTGAVDLTGKTDAWPANDDEWSRLVGPTCTSLGAGRKVGWLPISAESWAAGSRVVECVAYV